MGNANEIPVTDTKAITTIWLTTWGVISIVAAILFAAIDVCGLEMLAFFAEISFVCSVSSLVILTIVLCKINDTSRHHTAKMELLCLLLLPMALLCGLAAAVIIYINTGNGNENYKMAGLTTTAVYIAFLAAAILNRQMLYRYFGSYVTNYQPYSNRSTFLSIFKISKMQNNPTDETAPTYSAVPVSNKILIKSIITATLILVMLIPTTFIQSLITEREERQKQVVDEVSSKWALPQTVSAPYLVIPYTQGRDADKKDLIILPEQLNVKGGITEETRPRSIYKVLLYKSKLNFSGNFRPAINPSDSMELYYNEAKLCFGLSDSRGIEDKLTITLNNNPYTLLPGLPSNAIESTGVSVPVTLTADDLVKGINFNMDVALRGSGSLHFLPLASYSNFDVQSSWPGPSFDGNTLPAERAISGNGFQANWKFNAAQLPFTSVIKDTHVNTNGIAFGVSLVQPADQYVKSMRSAKYAILIIGLTFVLFFVFELMQKKPVHPVQYLLVGMALVIFYTLLISISEIILFDYAYIISAVATILLISLYAKAHFKTLRSAIIFGLLLSGLYGFIYVLISLEDTALLVGSIALFIVVAIIMYVTRKINWYQPEPRPALNIQP